MVPSKDGIQPPRGPGMFELVLVAYALALTAACGECDDTNA
jgi:hypothetical protein